MNILKYRSANSFSLQMLPTAQRPSDKEKTRKEMLTLVSEGKGTNQNNKNESRLQTQKKKDSICNRARFSVQWREVSISTSRDKQRVRGPCVVLLMVQLYTERIKLQIEVYNSDVGTRLNTHFPRKTITRDLGSSVSFLPDVPRQVTRAHCYSIAL